MADDKTVYPAGKMSYLTLAIVAGIVIVVLGVPAVFAPIPVSS